MDRNGWGEEGMATKESPVEQYPHRLGQKFYVLSNYLFIYFIIRRL